MSRHHKIKRRHPAAPPVKLAATALANAVKLTKVTENESEDLSGVTIVALALAAAALSSVGEDVGITFSSEQVAALRAVNVPGRLLKIAQSGKRSWADTATISQNASSQAVLESQMPTYANRDPVSGPSDSAMPGVPACRGLTLLSAVAKDNAHRALQNRRSKRLHLLARADYLAKNPI